MDQFAIASAVMLGAERVIAIDQYGYRLEMARNKAGDTDIIGVYGGLMDKFPSGAWMNKA